MDLDPYITDLQERLVTAAAAGGDDARRLAERLTAPLEAAVRLTLLDALSAAAGEISAELAPGSVDVRLRAGDPEFVVALPQAPASAPTASVPVPAPGLAPVAGTDDGSSTRTTLRLPDHLKTQVEAAATRDDVSVNTWLVRAVAGALGQPTRAAQAGPDQRNDHHVTGWMR
ncbi:histidine kinase [Cellulomonas composti]|uniref:Histidine kinase n=1 Tax=Cellulomonas composti TaxID=266130 RepID=A0A511JA45_9CELL|nr:histidine kinase [Cellulomonas composti]GEL94848.1 hypothetical protein CCO02nite_15060 [Cellulomonas composti]